MAASTLTRLGIVSLCTGGVLALTMCGEIHIDPQDTDMSSSSYDLAGSSLPPDLVSAELSITSLSRTADYAPGGATTTINGAGFQRGASVKFGPLTATVTSVSEPAIVVTVPGSGGLLGKVDVIVTNPDGGSATATRAFSYVKLPAFATTTFTAATDAYGPRAVYAVDLDGTSGIDLVVVNVSGNSYSVYLNQGTGSFTLKGTIPITGCTGPFSATIADVTGEGTPDLLVPCRDSNNAFFMKGNGDGSFGTPAFISLPGASAPQSIGVIDINGDQKMDLLVALNSAATNSLYRMTGNNTGAFTAATQFGTITDSIYSLLITDFDKDNKKDVVVTYDRAPPYGNVSFSFGRNPNQTDLFSDSGASPHSCAVADFNNDQKLDLVVANNGGNGTLGNFTVMTQQSGGSLIPGGSLPTTTVTNPEGIAAGDFNGDGNQDVVTANYGAAASLVGDLTLFPGDGKSGFLTGMSVSTGSSSVSGKPNSVVVADFNGDGRPDIAATNYRTTGGQLVILLNTGI